MRHSREHALEDVDGACSLATDVGFPVPQEPPEEAPDVLGVVGEPVDSEGVRVVSPKDGGRDGILVHIESDPEDYGANGHELVSFRLRCKPAHGSDVASSKPVCQPTHSGGAMLFHSLDVRS